MVGVPVHVPWSAVSVCPSVGVPLIAGSPVANGAAALVGLVAVLVAGTAPAAFVAVTTSRSVAPTSVDVRT